MTLQPLADRIIIEPLTAMEKSKGGIIIPDTAKKTQNVGIVRAVGHAPDECTPLHPGDKVQFEANAGDEYKENGKTYRIVRYYNILYKYNVIVS